MDKEKEILNKFYNERFATPGMPFFSELTEVQLLELKKSTGFAFYKFGCALDDLIRSIKNIFK
jgi:hypothetical protein